ncbi:co-chaperone GroES [Candidatus Roizmanbacteria bacterium CG_4_10_14_0_2_um_filter_36_35]|uniref:Co-chaperonin GroES n=4 Tax=Candidatus Roizmaniibacteriota TaxID=1752723 RepID=A0A2M7BW57_9BACT|nr:MAG: co-chaperone GroES [Candidatus Roizmanbacteria bacterium CG11_big_fil_rev_8_21_14_0_20_35_14]PIV10807.1 MAG: co-chaperone GroES [Candidatus Roizmanbacteria bacterium CG03_land_8_20_14_0_80_35_26]PIZ68265.1 MAG: co-chaperone GroES [Candidatus Roizmanbacteria bacterium CG_4_10_14_0_2_um_filter_36_35]PJC31440.1 MAG: co-chaperone GroES [Candidatus Roizmanbacteria bacterium CG_4_9_14_0_2_um_filter_36_12]PJC81097.1 MAG: co-chaperone GroES [Candidatus Roizmanbacteria bacterium CG_4_8_14_3_um_f
MSKTTGNIKPLFDYVLVKPLEGETKTPSGIVLPDSAKEKPQVGEIMAVGPGKSCCGESCCSDDDKCECEEMIVKVGQKVLYKKWGGNEVKVGNEEWLLIEQKDIMAIVQ